MVRSILSGRCEPPKGNGIACKDIENFLKRVPRPDYDSRDEVHAVGIDLAPYFLVQVAKELLDLSIRFPFLVIFQLFGRINAVTSSF
jgi:hypothetical protein